MLSSITIKNIASYDANGVELNELKKINFVYGANGSGKTTISNFLANQIGTDYSDCILQWTHDQKLNLLVYNKKFRENNFGKNDIDGVFTLGKATADELKLIEEKQGDLKKLKFEINQKKETLIELEKKKSYAEDTFKEYLWTRIYKKHENNFKEAFKGFIQKEKFKKKLLGESSNSTVPLLTFSDLTGKAKTIFGQEPENMDAIKSIGFDKVIDLENKDIWGNKIIGKSDVDISKLIQKLNINDWVNQGTKYIQIDNNICPFCQKSTITETFKEQLENYFDQSFTASVQKISDLSGEYNRLTDNFINELTQIKNNEKQNSDTKLDVDKFPAYLETLLSQVTSNKVLLIEKAKEPSRSIHLTSTKEQFDNLDNLVKAANEEVRKHNDIVNNYQSERRNLIASIWKYIAVEGDADTKEYKVKINDWGKGIADLNKHIEDNREKYTALNAEIKSLIANTTSIQPTIDEINKTLQYYGFDNFEIVPSESNENYYQIKREDGTLAASTLSEGEITFITFLYFLQLAKGSTNKETITEERILVIDDPVSSLDSNVLFVVGALIKAIIKDIKGDIGNIKQLFLLTHNVYFHKEVSFINGRTNGHNQTNYWILRKNNKVSSIQPFCTENPIKTFYRLLWTEIQNRPHSCNITIQNTMRRIIEDYFKMLGGYTNESLIKQFESKEEQEIFRSLICWVNDGSHNISDDLYIESGTESTDKYLKVFKDIFIKTGHENHYNMMMNTTFAKHSTTT